MTKPQGVRGRNSDNTLLRTVTGGWEPRVTLAQGLIPTYLEKVEQVEMVGQDTGLPWLGRHLKELRVRGTAFAEAAERLL